MHYNSLTLKGQGTSLTSLKALSAYSGEKDYVAVVIGHFQIGNVGVRFEAAGPGNPAGQVVRLVDTE